MSGSASTRVYNPFGGDRSQLLECWPHQLEFVNLDKQISVILGSVQNGKSRACGLKTVRKMWSPRQFPDHVDRVGWIIVPTRQPFWDNLKLEVERIWGFASEGGLILHKTEQPPRYILRGPNGRNWLWRVHYAENPDTLRTASVAIIWATEIGLYKPEVWGLLQMRVAKSRGVIYADSSPQGLNWVNERIIKRASLTVDYRPTYKGGEVERVSNPDGDSRIGLVKGVKIGANRFMSPEDIELMRANMSSEQARRELDGEFFNTSDTVLFSFNPDVHVCKSLPPEAFMAGRGEWMGIAGLDYGWTDKTAHVWAMCGGRGKKPRYVICDEYEEGGRTLKTHVEIWKANPWNPHVRWRYDDPSGAQEHNELIELDLGVTQANNDVELGINKLNQLIENGQLLVMDRCSKLIDQMVSWRRNEKTGKPEHCGDVIHALRYMVFTHALRNDGKPVPSGFVEGNAVKWKLPSGEVVETTREAEEKEMMTDDGVAREIV